MGPGMESRVSRLIHTQLGTVAVSLTPTWSWLALLGIDMWDTLSPLWRLLCTRSATPSPSVHVGSSFQHYSGGIYSDPNCRYGQLNHAVLLVGYNKDSWGQGYWIVKNSWGSGWGQGGYIHMKMGENSCGLANSGMYPLV